MPYGIVGSEPNCGWLGMLQWCKNVRENMCDLAHLIRENPSRETVHTKLYRGVKQKPIDGTNGTSSLDN
jgi:hypothetical protein